MTANPCLTWVITDTNDPSLTNMNTYKCKIVGGKSKVYLLCDLQNHLRVMFDWYSLSSLHWGLKRKDIGVKWCLRTALYLCARKIYIFYHIIRRNGSIFVIEVFLCFAFFWAPTKEFKTLILVYMLFFLSFVLWIFFVEFLLRSILILCVCCIRFRAESELRICS